MGVRRVVVEGREGCCSGVGQESHPTCHTDMLGGHWGRSGWEWDKKGNQRVDMTRWVVSVEGVGGMGYEKHPTC